MDKTAIMNMGAITKGDLYTILFGIIDVAVLFLQQHIFAANMNSKCRFKKTALKVTGA